MAKLYSKYKRYLLIWVLPVVLLAITGLLFGYYYESNDDVAITQVLRGETAIAPVSNLHLYFHGLSYLLATLYEVMPHAPWFGILLYVLLYISLVLLYHVLYDVLVNNISEAGLALCFSLIYWFGWQDTALLMNYTRLPILLVGTGVLYMASRSTRVSALAIGLVVVILGWSIRPSAGVLGLVVAIPGAWWLAKFRSIIPIVGAGLVIVIGSALVSASYSPVERTYRSLDVWKASYSDFLLYRAEPTTSADSLGILSVENWALGDSTVVNEQLFERSMRFDRDEFVRHTILHKSFASFYVLRDYYALLVLFPMVIGIWLSVRQRWYQHWEYWVAQVAITALLLTLTVAMKLPLRVASPLLSLWAVGVLIYVVCRGGVQLRIAMGWRWILGIVFVIFSYKTWRESREYYASREKSEAYLDKVYQVAKNHTLVVGGVEWCYVFLSPFKTYDLSDSPVVTLAGWLTLEPSLTELREQLTGTRDFEQSLQKLAADPNVVWMMRTSFADYLKMYSQRHASQSAEVLVPIYKEQLSADPEFAQLYQVKLVPPASVAH